MKKIILIFVLALVITAIITSCNKNSYSESIGGVYSFEDSSIKLKVTIDNNAWIEEVIVLSEKTGEYNMDNVGEFYGILKGNDLYNNAGTEIIGSVKGKSLKMNFAGKKLTLKLQDSTG
jgi:hypothetical protein